MRFYNADVTLAPRQRHHNQRMLWEEGKRRRREETAAEKSFCHFLALARDRPSLLTWPCSFSITLRFDVCAQPRQTLLMVKVCHYFLPTSSPLPCTLSSLLSLPCLCLHCSVQTVSVCLLDFQFHLSLPSCLLVHSLVRSCGKHRIYIDATCSCNTIQSLH